ncbi:hypothetical protein FHX37_1046 [Haloactinospora alba]|uniref:Uncharacterized protein n=1 Tax=Haloactinospora alba TaxID=405555 RepID=A0A543NHA2_9ACTN|nr:hypothetical protein [Haloactinospora alba]TQN31154.1 hypothetical protein FHX37_1046 [Haloactinospora alba]
MTTTQNQDTLERLREDYPGWRIWRSRRGTRPAGWVATSLTPQDGRAPTLHADTAEELELQLKNPPMGIGLDIPGQLEWSGGR